MEIRKDVAEMLKKERLTQTLTQKQMAEETSISLGRYGKLERGQAKPSKADIEILAEVLGLGVADFYEVEEVVEKIPKKSKPKKKNPVQKKPKGAVAKSAPKVKKEPLPIEETVEEDMEQVHALANAFDELEEEALEVPTVKRKFSFLNRSGKRALKKAEKLQEREEKPKIRKGLKREKKGKPPTPKMITHKQGNLIVQGVTIAAVAMIALGTVRLHSAASTIQGLQAEVQELRLNGNGQDEELNVNFDMPLIERYMSEFLPEFINVNTSSPEFTLNRQRNLEQFFSFDISNQNNQMGTGLERELIDYELINVRNNGNHNIVRYLITYEIVENETENNTNNNSLINRTRNTSVLSVPFVERGGLMAVVSLPFFTSEETIFGVTDGLEMMEQSDNSAQMAELIPSIREFLPIFFEMYANSNSTELNLFMESLQLMGGNYELEEVHIDSARYRFVGHDVVVQTQVSFRSQDTSFVHTENFTLRLRQQENSWFVVDLQNVFV